MLKFADCCLSFHSDWKIESLDSQESEGGFCRDQVWGDSTVGVSIHIPVALGACFVLPVIHFRCVDTSISYIQSAVERP